MVAGGHGGNLLQARNVGALAGNMRIGCTFVTEKVFGVSPALAFFTNQVFCRYADIDKFNPIEIVAPVDRNDRVNSDAGCFCIHAEEGDAFLLLARIISPNKTEQPVGIMSLAGPYFCTVDDIVVTIALRLALK